MSSSKCKSIVPMFSLPSCFMSTEQDPVEILIEQERRDFLTKCLAELTLSRQIGFESVYGLGNHCSVAEAAKSLNKSRATLYQHHTAELKKIREKFSEAGLL